MFDVKNEKDKNLYDETTYNDIPQLLDQKVENIQNLSNPEKLNEYKNLYAIQDSIDRQENENQVVGNFRSPEHLNFTGLGKLRFANNDFYEGQWMKGKMHGNGTLTSSNGQITYVGQFRNNFKWGKGKILDKINQYTYEGTFVANKIEGEGSHIDHRNDTRYFGHFKDGERNGQGNCVYPSGNRFSGLWKNNIPYQGELFLRKGDRLQGEWKDDHFSGSGTIQFFNGNLYEGEWKNNIPHGFGAMKYNDGSVYNGQWQQGQK